MEAVLMSIHPKWCDLIAHRQKTIEIRKSAPKLSTPFKVYIYCTKCKNYNYDRHLGLSSDELYKMPDGTIKYGCSLETTPEYYCNTYNGKVIGEFVCDHINKIVYNDGGYLVNNNTLTTIGTLLLAQLTETEIREYLGERDGYAWYMDNLVIYDEPRELSEYGLTRPPQSWYYVNEMEV